VRWYTGDPVYDSILLAALLMPPIAVLLLRFLDAPYGRFGDEWPFPKYHARTGWFLMELPATAVFWPAFLSGPHAAQTVPVAVACIWAVHYANRGFIFPLLMRVPRGTKTFSIVVLTTGALVTTLHGYLNGYWVSRYAEHLYAPDWVTDPRFLGGVALYAVGLWLNIHSDTILRRLRTPEEVARGEKVYRIPRGGGFNFVTNPQYLGELMIWLGFATLTWSLGGVFILMISLSNLVPRAITTHKWYRDEFPDYPKHRKILVPFVF
jgi:3-oxo-5-alpha-steroid 4-dehydrogenase 1